MSTEDQKVLEFYNYTQINPGLSYSDFLSEDAEVTSMLQFIHKAVNKKKK